MWSWVKMVFSGLFLGFTACAHADLAIDPLPFPPGETLTYKLHWGFFHVGTGVLSVKGPLTFQGEPAYRLTFNLRTNGFADALYPIRDIHVSYVNLDFTRTLHISKKEKHKNKSRVVEVIFDWVKKTAQYSLRGKTREPITLPGDAYDPLTSIFAARLWPLKVGLTRRVLMTDGKKYRRVPVQVFKKKKLHTKFGSLEAFLVQPDLREVSVAFEKPRKTYLQFWVSNDHRKLPLKIISKVKWGSFRAELQKIDQIPTGNPGKDPS